MPPYRSHTKPRPDTGSNEPDQRDRVDTQTIESSLNSIQSHLDQASSLAEQGACSALFAHEVNNLMTQVGGRAQLALLHPNKPDLTAKALELAIHASNQIAELAQSLMTNSESEITNSPTAFASISQIHEQTLAYLAQHDVSAYRFEIEDVNLADSTQAPTIVLGQVLLNLYLNAIRAIEESGRQPSGIVAVRLMTVESALDCSTGNNSDAAISQIQIVVEDNGIGMTENQIRTMTKSSGWVEADSINENHPRHGYGLKVSRELLEQVGGTLDAQSAPGEGTRMMITLPHSENNTDSTRAAA